MQKKNSAISTQFPTFDDTLQRPVLRERKLNSNRDTMTSVDNDGVMHGVIGATRRSYVNSSGGQVDERDLCFVGSTTDSTDDNGVQTWTRTQRVLRGRSRTTITDYSLDSMSHLPASMSHFPTLTMNGSENNRNTSINASHQQNQFATVRECEIQHGQHRMTALPDSEGKRHSEIRHGQQRTTPLPDFGEKYYAKPIQLSSHRAFVDDQIGSKDVFPLRNPSTSFDQRYFEKASSSSSAVDPFINMTNSFQPLIERQRNEFIHLFPHFKNVKFAEPEVLVRSIKQPDGSELIIETKVTRRQVEFRKTTTIVNGVIQSSTSRAIMVYGGPKNGFQVKFEQIQGSPEDSEVEDDEDDTKNRLAITAASEADDDNESALVRLDDVNGIQELKMKKLDKAWLSAKELVDTERRYVSKLHLLDQVFRPKLEQMQDKTVANEKIAKLFSNLGSLYTFHNDHLLRQLEESLREWKRSQKICDVMCKMGHYLKMYGEYTNSYNKSTKIYYDLKRKSKRFAEIVDEIQALPECENLPLETHIICPVQRVARYHLLLQQYLDYLPPDHVDREDAEKALKLVKESANHANNLMRKLDKYKDVIEVQEALGSQMQGLVTPSRELIKKGRLTKISRRATGFQDRHIFLFNDLLLVCSDRRMSLSKYKLRAALSFDGLQILESDNLEFENTFAVRWRNRLIELLAKTADEKTQWMEALWSAVEQYTKDRESFRQARSNFSDATCGTKDSSKTCSVCKAAFKFIWNDEYTCKLCKMPVCKKCSKKESDEKCRICIECCDKKKSQSFNNLNTKMKSTENEPSEKQCVMKGNLEIRSSKTAYTPRFFVLHSDSSLHSFKNETSQIGSSLFLHGSKITLVDPRQDSAAPVNSFVFKIVHPNRIYYFKVANEEDLIKWMAALELASQAEPNY